MGVATHQLRHSARVRDQDGAAGGRRGIHAVLRAGSAGASWGVVGADGVGNVSEETLKPELKAVNLNGSVGSLVSEVGFGVMNKMGRGASSAAAGPVPVSPVSVPGARIVRIVATGRKRSTSVGVVLSDRERSEVSVSLDSPSCEEVAMSTSLPTFCKLSGVCTLKSV